MPVLILVSCENGKTLFYSSVFLVLNNVFTFFLVEFVSVGNNVDANFNIACGKNPKTDAPPETLRQPNRCNNVNILVFYVVDVCGILIIIYNKGQIACVPQGNNIS